MRIKKCRICGNKKLTKIGSLGKIAISDFTDKSQEGTRYPLELVYCGVCTLFQLAHNIPRDLLYRDYWYKSSLNKVIVNDLKEIAKYVKAPCIDIGGNDGTLLKYVKGERWSIDPSQIQPPQDVYWINDYWEEESVRFTHTFRTITAIACLYDLPNPNKFLKKVKDYLFPNDGVFISQFQPLAEMIELNDVGNICHEHLEYYSYKSLVYLFEKNGLEIFKVEKNKMNGGSYRIFARHYKKGSIKFKEKEYGVKELKDFFKRIEKNKNDFLRFLEKVNKDNKYIRGYGASTKANTILQYYGIKMGQIVDINPDKIGKYTINSNNEIIGKIPDYCDYLWCFPYGFIDYFKKKEKGYKGKWVTAIPKFKII